MKEHHKRKGECAYCGQHKEVTRDHVFPRGLFTNPQPKDHITVDACEECNSGYQLDEEFFNTFIAARASSGAEGQRLWKKRVAGSSFRRSPKFKQYISDLFGYEELITPAGLFLGQVPILRIREK